MNFIPPLFYAKLMCLKNRFTHAGSGVWSAAGIFVVLAGVFWAGLFILCCRVLGYFESIDVLGAYLASRLLSMIVLTVFSILVFSNIITAISSCFMSKELTLNIASPYDKDSLYITKFFETLFHSSWMVVLFCLPVFISYGVVFDNTMQYYAALWAVLPPFLIICAVLGIMVTLTLVCFFPARRLKDILFLLSIVFIIGLYFLFRLLRPERLVDPDAFFTVVDYLSSLRTPTSPFLPSQWVSETVGYFLFDNQTGFPAFSLLLLWSTAAAFFYMLNRVFRRVFFYAWSRSREANTARVTRHSCFAGFLEMLLRPIPQQARALIEKDVRFFFRDTSQWSQLLILSAIIIIYLYNYSVLPLEKSPMPTHQVSNLLAFINLGLTGFVVSAVAVRFAFPAVSLEGNAFWIVRTAPVRAGTFLWSKFWIHAVFLTVIAEILIVFSNYLLHVDMVMMIISAATVFFMTLTLTCLSIGLGSVFPRFSHENVSQIPTGAGGFLYMVIAVLFVAAVVVLEARPVHIIITSQIQASRLETAQTLYIAVSFLVVIFLCALIAWVSMKKGMHSLLKRE